MRIDRLIILSLVVACKATVPTSTATYKEDLSVHRPVQEDDSSDLPADDEQVTQEAFVPLSGHIKSELDSISKIAYQENKEGRYVDGYVIQVYSGGSRDEANEVRYKMNGLFPELMPKITYHQPSFRVKGGKFINRLEAHRVYALVKEEFPRALLIPERFLLKYE